MKKLLLILLVLSSTVCFGQKKKPVKKAPEIKGPFVTWMKGASDGNIPSMLAGTTMKKVAVKILRKGGGPVIRKVGKKSLVVCSGTKYLLTPTADNYGTIIQSNNPGASFYFPLHPGDTLVLGSGHTWSFFSMSHVNGTADCPVVIINDAGVPTFSNGIDLNENTYIKVTGSGGAAFYGINIFGTNPSSVGVAVAVQGKSHNIEIERINIYQVGYIAWIKQDPLCDSSYNYPHYTMDSINFHHVKAKRIFQDGIYAGNTDPNGRGFRFYNCYGTSVQFIPMRVSNIKIHDLDIDSVGRTAIQLSGGFDGVNEIYNNTIRNTGYEWNQQQGVGISLGLSQAHVYGNTIKNTFLYGILDLGVGTQIIEGNNIDSSGYIEANQWQDVDSLVAAHPGIQRVGTTRIIRNSFSQPTNIWIDTRSLTSTWGLYTNNRGIEFDSTRFVVRNNVLGRDANGNSTIRIYTNEIAKIYKTRNIICSNTSTIGTVQITERCTQDPTLVPCVNMLTNCGIPYSFAGSDESTSASSFTLSGFGVPVYTHSILRYNWQKISGPGATSIPNPDLQTVTATGLVPGTYVFRLTVSQDDDVQAVDDKIVTVMGPPAPPVDPRNLIRRTLLHHLKFR